MNTEPRGTETLEGPAAATPSVSPDVDGYLRDPRLRCCLEAAVELAALLKMVQGCMRRSENSVLKIQTRAILARAAQLCNTLQDGLGDDTVTTEQMLAVLNLEGQ